MRATIEINDDNGNGSKYERQQKNKKLWIKFGYYREMRYLCIDSRIIWQFGNNRLSLGSIHAETGNWRNPHCLLVVMVWESLFMGRRLSDALFLDRLKSGSFEIQSRDKATIDAHGVLL